MKSKIRLLMMACFLFIAGSFMLPTVPSAKAACPNGCVQGYTGCFCHTFYWTLAEYDWGDDDDHA